MYMRTHNKTRTLNCYTAMTFFSQRLLSGAARNAASNEYLCALSAGGGESEAATVTMGNERRWADVRRVRPIGWRVNYIQITSSEVPGIRADDMV